MSFDQYPTFRTVDPEPAQEAALRAFGDITLGIAGNTRPFRWDVTVIPVGPIILLRHEIEGDVVLAGVTSRYVLTTPDHGHLRVATKHEMTNMEHNSGAAVFSPTVEVNVRSPDEIRSRGICIEPHFMQTQLHALTGETVERLVTFDLQMNTNSGSGAWLRQLTSLLHETIGNGLEPNAHPALATSLSEAIVRALLLGQPHDYSHLLKRAVPPSSRSMVRLAEEYMDAHAAEPMQVADLAKVTGTSLRALESAFLSHRGTTPTVFLRKRRLELARQLLLSNPNAGVMKAAHTAGFLQKNTFEDAYFKTFGEKPAQTQRSGYVATDAKPPSSGSRSSPTTPRVNRALVIVVHGDLDARRKLSIALRQAGYDVETFESAPSFLAVAGSTTAVCVLVDSQLSSQTGLEWQSSVAKVCPSLPLVFFCKQDDASGAVALMKGGASDVLVEPFENAALLDAVKRAQEQSAKVRAAQAQRDLMTARIDALSPREREVCALVARGLLNKQIAAELQISEVTVKIHRARGMERLGVTSAAELSNLFTSFRNETHSKI